MVLRSIALTGVIAMVACGGSDSGDLFRDTTPNASGGGDASAPGGSGGSAAVGGTSSGGADGGTSSQSAGTSGGGTSPGGAAGSTGTAGSGGTGGSSGTSGSSGTAGSAGTAGSGGASGSGVTPDGGVTLDGGVSPSETCTNGVQDGDETDVDCGGHCPGCATGGSCTSASDCEDKRCGCATVPFCFGDTCLAPRCNDGIHNGLEGDVDCGGSCATPCPTGASCGASADCEAGPCVAGVCTCAPYTCGDIPDACGTLDDGCGDSITCPPCSTLCSDGKANVNETDVDCGGSDCSPCPAGSACSTDADCVTGVCQAAVFSGWTCRAAACGDGVRNGDESDVDCGGSCTLCEPGHSCNSDADCSRGPCQGGVCGCTPLICADVPNACGELDDQCGSTVTCQPCADLCSDSLQDGSETDVDCGGPDCDTCNSGKSCNVGTDCKSGTCSVVICGPFCTTRQCSN